MEPNPEKLGPIVGPPIRSYAINVPLQKYSNSYDEYYRPEYNQVWNRSNNQSGLEQIGYGFTSRALSIVPKIGAGLGSIAGLAMAGTSGDVSEIWDNPITNWFNGLDDALKEQLPVYSSQQNDTSGLLGKMSTTSFWANDAFDGIAYAASAFVPGLIIGKGAQAISGGLKATQIGKKLTDGLKAIGATTERSNLVLSTAYNTVSEAAAEAFQTQKELEAIYTGMGLDPKDAKLKAGEASARVFNANLTALVAPNLIQNSLFHGGFGKLNDSVRAQVFKDGTTENVKKLNSIWSKIGGSVASEGFWEENIQTSLQQWEKNAAISGNNGDNWAQEVGLNMANNIGGFLKSFVPGTTESSEQVEGATSIFLGGLIGAGAAARGYVQEKKALDKLKADELARRSSLFDVEGKAAVGIFADNVNSIYKSKGKKIVSQDGKDVEIEDFELDSNGNPIINEEAVHKMTLNQLRNKHLWDAQMIAAYRNDPALAEMNKQMALGSYVYSLMNNKYEYTPEEIGIYLDKMAETGNEEAKQLGVESYISQNMATAKEYASQLATIRNNNTSIAKDVSADPKEARFSDFITKTEFYLNIKRNALLEIQKQTLSEQGKESIGKLLEDNAGYLSQIKNERSKLKSEFNSTIIDTAEKARKRNLAVKNKDKKTADALSYQLLEDQYINGQWGNTENSRELPSQEARIASKIAPGTKDSFNYTSGKSLIAVDRVAAALQNEEDIADIADNFIRGVQVIPKGFEGLVKTQQSEIADRLANEFARVEEEAGAITQLTSAVEDITDEDYPYSIADTLSVQGGIDPQDTANILTEVNQFGGNFTPESTTEEVVTSDAWQQYQTKNNAKLDTVASRFKELSKLKDKVDNFEVGLKDKVFQEYQDAPDKEMFLKNDFFKTVIGNPAQGFIEDFKAAPEEIRDDNNFNAIKEGLEQAIAGSDSPYVQTKAKELLDYFETVIGPQIMKNIYNRGKIHITINNKVAGAMVASLPKDIISQGLSQDTSDYLQAIYKADIVSFDAILNTIQAIKNKSPELATEVLNAVVGKANSLIESYITDLYDSYPELQKTFDSLRGTDKLRDRVYYHTQNIIRQHFTRKYDENLPPEVVKYLSDVDMYALNSAASRSSTLDNQDKELVRATHDLYFKLIGTSTVTNLLNSTLDISRLEAFKDTFTDKTPSLQQNIAFTQALTFLHSNTHTSNFNSWLLVRGIGGSGKTHFLGQELKRAQDELLGKPAKVMAFSKEAMTSANINKAVFGDKTLSTHQDFLNLSEEELSKFDFIIIDEVFTFSDAELYEINSKAAAAKVKIIALGDSSQITVETSPAILSALEINMTLPLTTSYRTNVTSIAAFIDKFRLNTREVSSHIATSNVDVATAVSNPATASGVVAMSPENLDQMLSTPSARSRVLIVPNNSTKNTFSNRYPNVDVRTAAESQGIQWDEVYSMLDTDVAPIPFEANRILYTAYSRAKHLLVVTQLGVSNSNPTNETDATIKNSDNELANIVEMFVTNMNDAKQMNSILNGQQSFTTEQLGPTEVLQNEEPVTDPHISYAMSTEHVQDLADPITNFSGIEFFNPSNYGVKDYGGPGVSRLERGSKVHFVRTSNGSIFVLGKVMNTPNKYFILAKIGREDLEGPAKSFLNNVSKVSKATVDENLLTSTPEFDIPDMNRLSIGEAAVADFVKFKTLYGTNYHSDTTGLIAGANDLIEDAIIRHYTTYNIMSKLTTDKPWVVQKSNGSYSVLWENIPASAVSMVVPTKRASKSETFGWDNALAKDLSVYYGTPYLVIRPNEKADSRALLVRFQPKKLGKDNMYVKTIRDFAEAVEAIEVFSNTILSTPQFEALVSNYAKSNYKVEDGQMVMIGNPTLPTEYKNNPDLHIALQKAIEMLYTPQEQLKRFGTKESAEEYLQQYGTPQENTGHTILNGKVIVGIDQRGDKLFVLKQSSDPTDTNVTTPYREWNVAIGEGIAQRALNSLAAANNRIGNLQFRQMQERVKPGEANDPYKLKIGRSPSILLSGAYTDYAGFYKDPFLTNYLTPAQITDFEVASSDPATRTGLFSKLINALEEGIMAKESATRTEAREFAMLMVDEYKTAPITLDLLHKISGDKAFDANGEHTSLRTPIKLHTPSKDGIHDIGDKLKDKAVRNKLTSQLRHNFEGFQRTQVWYTSPEIAEVPKPEPTPITTTIRQLLNKVGDTGVKAYDDIVALLKRINIDAPVVHLPNGIPYEKNGVIEYGQGAATVVTNGVTSVEYSGFLFNEIGTSIPALNIFLHESLHVASKQALYKGQLDTKKKLDTKEAAFYTRMISIKKRFDAAIKSKRNPATGERFKTSEVYLETYSKLDVNEFVANLSNPSFVELAKSISLLPDSKKKSMLRELLETIVDFFKSLVGGNPSVYDAAIASLEEYYSNSVEPANNLAEYVQPTVTITVDDIISEVSSAINKASEFAFDITVNKYKQKWAHVLDVNSFPESYGDEFELSLTSQFSSMPEIEQSLLLNKANASGAWYDITKDRMTFSSGSILTSQGVTLPLDKLIPEDYPTRVKNLLRSIVRLETLGIKVLDNLISYSREQALDILFNNVLSNVDKQTFRVDLNTATDAQSKAVILSENHYVGENIDLALTFLIDNYSEIQRIVEQSRDRSTDRYRVAKLFIEQQIKANITLDNLTEAESVKLIKTNRELKKELKDLVNDPNPKLPSGLTLMEAQELLMSYYDKVEDYRKSSNDPLERNELLFSIIPQLENEINGIKALSMNDANTNKSILDLILKDIYPNADFSELSLEEELLELADADFIPSDDVDTELLELADISDYMKRYDKSYENTLSESLKNSFRRITLGNKSISPGLAYIKTLQLVMSLDWNTAKNTDLVGKPEGLDYISAQLKQLYADTSSELQRKIIQNLIDLISYSKTSDFLDTSINFENRSFGIVMFKDESKKIKFAAYSAAKTIPNSTTLSYQEIVYRMGQGEDIKLSALVENTTSLYNWLSKEQPMSIKQFNRLFTKGEAINTIRAVHNTMASMKETLLYTANRSNKKGNEFRLQRGVASGVNFKIKEQLIANLITIHDTVGLAGLKPRFEAKTINGEKINRLRDTPEGKIRYIKEFFKYLNINVSDIQVSSADINGLINDIEGFLNRTTGIEKYTVQEDIEESFEKVFDVFEWVETSEGIDGYLSRFSKVLSSSDKLSRNASVRDAKGGKFYVNHESSHLYDTLLNLIELDKDNPVFRGGSGSNRQRNIPEHIKSNYFDHNIFARGSVVNRLYSVIEIDGARNLGNNSVTSYTRENMFFFYHRNFSQQFVDAIRQHKNSYFQSTFTPSDSPKALAVRVGVLSDNPKDGKPSQILSAIELVFKQALQKRGLSGAGVQRFDNSVRDDLFRNFRIALRGLKLADLTVDTFTEADIPRVSKFVYELMSVEANELLNELTNSNVKLTLDKNTYLYAQNILDKLNISQFDIKPDTYGTAKNPTPATTYKKGEYVVDKDLLRPLLDLWFKNSYINGFFVNQLVTGDYSFYANSGAIIKRYAGVKAPRIKPLIDPVVGMRQTRKVLILGDQVNTKDDARKVFADLLYGIKPDAEGVVNIPSESIEEFNQIMDALPDKFDSTDAQGFSTKQWIAELSRGFEAAWGVGDVSKPVHFGLDKITIENYSTSKPSYNKYSSIHLDEVMTTKFPILRKLQIALEKLGVDEAIFNTGTKLGVPIPKLENGEKGNMPSMFDIINFTDEQLSEFRDKWQINTIVELDNSGFGFQFNAEADPNKKVSLFTQLMYFLNSYPDKLASEEFETTQTAAKEVYNLVGALIASGRERFLKEIGNDKASLIRFLKNNLTGSGSERALQLLEVGISIDNPLIEKKAIISLASGLEKAAVKTKFKGGKLVLQTPEGISKYQDPKLFSEIDPSLASSLTYRKELLPNGNSIIVAECIVPKEMLIAEQLVAVQSKQSIYLMPDMLGFRLPSTEFHSAVAIRVVGVYSNRKTNVIIAPKELVPIQGQDFDVDALFVINQEVFTESETSVINGEHLKEFADTLHNLLHELSIAELELDPKHRGTITKLRKAIKKDSGLMGDPLEESPATIEDKIEAIIASVKSVSSNADVASAMSEVLYQVSKFRNLLKSKAVVIGQPDAPVGYKMVRGKYVIDTEFLTNINASIESLKSISKSNEIMPALSSTIKSELRKAEALREKYMKNRILDIMVTVISDRNNAGRAFTAISFNPLDEAINQFTGDATSLIKTNDNLDLAHPRGQFDSYLSVASGQILIGAFANASKSFGYLARAGGDDRQFIRVNTLKRALKQIEANPEFNASEVISPLYKDEEIYNSLLTGVNSDTLKKLIAEEEKNDMFIDRYKLGDITPALSPNQAFVIEEDGLTTAYNSLASIDSDNKYRTTQSYSTLTNAAVDDLNQGYLSRMRINTNTGPAIMGLVAVGVPFRLAIKLFYQPIFSALAGGKINNLDSWISDITKTYGVAVQQASIDPLNVVADLDPFINDASKHRFQSMDTMAMLEAMTPQEQVSQLKALSVFIKANKIGVDFKNLAAFLNILRQWDVLVEKLESLEDTLNDKIGKIVELPTGELALQPNSDFSFNIPNLLEGSNHIKEAYVSHKQLRDKIQNSFRIHSSPIKKLAEDIYRKLDLDTQDKRNVLLVEIRRALQFYLTVGEVAKDMPKEVILQHEGRKFISSGTRTFLSNTANNVKKVQEFAMSIGDSNLFLENIVTTFDKYQTASLIFKTGVGLQPEDTLDLVKGFKDLNQYKIEDGKVVKYLPEYTTDINDLQRDLIKYSILTSGLQYGGSGFSSYVTPAALVPIDKAVNEKLDDLSTGTVSDAFKEHFVLSYSLINAPKLPWVSFENVIPAVKAENPKDNIYAGMEMIEENPVYFDLKVQLETKKNGTIAKPQSYIRREFGKSITVYKLVAQQDSIVYYQVVGKANNVVYTPVSQSTNYDIANMFNPNVPSVYYSYKDGNKIHSRAQLLNTLNVGDIVYIYPTYSYDRTARERVIIKSKSKSDVEGMVVTVEPLSMVTAPVVQPTLYPPMESTQDVKTYAAALKELGYSETQIGEAIKQNCQ